MTKTIRFKVFRFNPSTDSEASYDQFDVPTKPGMTVLEALFHIQRNIDDSLVFRYSCRGAVCGTCSMVINKFPRLACRTQISELAKERKPELKVSYGKLLPTIDFDPQTEILLEPLPNFEIIKDLVVELAPFWEKFEKVKPWVISKSDPSGKMTPELAKSLDRAANCFLCALCYGSCPINNQYKEYVGPAALARAWRFIEDPTDVNTKQRLIELKTKPEGALGCEYFYNCVKVCPRQVAPAMEIRKIRTKMGEK
jgi:succinate dehydrogenase / fumarate reductase iron-sulfur subunit